MTTSLAAQLKLLQVAPTQSLSATRRRHSFLFDRNVHLENETLFALCVQGLEELEYILPEFRRFHATLFNESSMFFVRNVQNADVNEKLDNEVTTFLRLLSPFLLLRPAHKALEWLVQRYQVNQYNATELVKCALPYHETKVFVRVVQLLDLDRYAKYWLWLKSCQDSGFPLSKQAVFNRCSGYVDFLAFVCKMASDSAQIEVLRTKGFLRTIIAFYMSNVLGTLEYCNGVSEVILTTLLPHILTGLKSDCLDYVSASYVILSELSRKATIVVDVWNPLLETICLHFPEDLSNEALSCLIIVCESQKLETLPEKCCNQLLDKTARSSLVGLSNHYRVFPVVRALVRHQLELLLSPPGQVSNSNKKTFYRTVQKVRLSNSEIEQLMRIFFNIYLKNNQINDQSIAFEFMEQIGKRFSGDFDGFLEQFVLTLTDVTSDAMIIELIQAFQLSCTVQSTSSNRFLALNHPNVFRRKLAVEEMAKSACSDLDDDSYWKLVKERLNDDHPSIVAAILECKRLITCVGSDELLNALMDVLENHFDNEDWQDVRERTLNVMARIVTEEVSEATMQRLHICLLPLLFLTDDRISEANIVLSLDIPFFAHVAENTDDELRQQMVLCVAEAVVKMPVDHKKQLMETLTDNYNCRTFTRKSFTKFRLIQLCDKIVSAEEDPLLTVKFASNFLGCLRNSQKKKSVHKAEITDEVLDKLTAFTSSSSNDESCWEPQNTIMYSIANMIFVLQLSDEMSELSWFDVHETQSDLTKELLRVHTELFKTLLYGLTHAKGSVTILAFSHLLTTWKTVCFLEEIDFLKFLVFLLTLDVDRNTVVIHLHALRTIEALCKSADVKPMLQLTNFIPVLFVASSSAIEAVREVALSCVSVIAEKVGRGETYNKLLIEVASRKVEITSDGSLLSNLVSSYFQSEEPSSEEALESFLALIVGNIKNKRHPLPLWMQNGLLLCLEQVDKPEVLLQLLPILESVMETTNRTAEQHEIVTNITYKFSPATAQIFSTSPDSFDVFLKVLHDCRYSRLANLPSLQMTLLSRISKNFFVAIETDNHQQNLMRNLIDLQVGNEDHVAVHKLAKVLRKVMLDGKQIKCELIRTTKPIVYVNLLKEVKKLKSDVTETVSDDLIRKRGIIILEALQGRRNINHAKLLVPVLFNVLKRCLEGGDPLTVEYEKQLVLSSLHNFVSQMNADDPGFKQDQFNVVLIVDCIRSSTSPKTQQEALFLLALAAKIFPDHVMHNTMAIFTFMGQNVSRHEDKFSFDVIISTMEAIVPAIMERSRLSTNSAKTEDETAYSLIRVFVDALPDIPEHRRIPLFSCLVSSLGHDVKFVWPTVALIFEKLITYDKGAENAKSFERRPILEFAVQLSHCYTPLCQVMSCEKLLSYIIDLKDVDEPKRVLFQSKNAELVVNSTDVLNMRRHVPKLRCHFKLLMTEFISMLLSSRPFLAQVVALQPEQTDVMTTSYQVLLEKILTSAHHVAYQMEKSGDSPLMKYWKVLQHHTYELLDKLSSLLPSNLFTRVINNLMMDSKSLVRRKALEILATKLQHPGQQLDPTNHESISELVPTLLKIVQSKEADERVTVNGDSTVEVSSNKQMALLSLKYICRIIGATHPDLFGTVLTVVTDVVRDESAVDHVRASALLYMAEHCQALRSQSVPHLATFVPALLTVLDDLDRVIRNELLLLSVVTALHKIVERVCQFLSPYLECILEKVCRLSTHSPKNTKSPLVVRLASIRHNIATMVAPRILFPAIESCFDLFSRDHHESIKPLMQTLREYITVTDKEQLALWHGPLFNFFLSALDYRVEHQDDERLLEIEGSVMEPMLATILKMSEATFRPFFIKLFDWAVRGDVPLDRILTFYRVVNRIADQLKSLFVLFAGHLIKNAATLLDQNNSSKPGDSYFEDSEAHKRGILVRYILETLHKCFLYDNERFVNKDRFETLLQPLVDQIENDSKDYQSHICDHLAPCLSQLAVAAANEALWKPLNFQVLLKTRHQAPKIRFGALQILREITKGVGEEYISLLPETIPFLAELMEDENPEVEQLCQAVIADMEGILGESLQEYF